MGRLSIVAFLPFWLVACQAPAPGKSSLSGQDGSGNPIGGPVLITVAETVSVAVGENASARCFLSTADGLTKPDRAVVVSVSPPPPDVRNFEDSVQFSTTVSGNYRAACRYADGSVVDPVGATIVVRAGAPFEWSFLPPTASCFGQADVLNLDYAVSDAYGNVIIQPNLDLQISPSTGVTGDAWTGLRFYKSGTYNITLSVIGDLAAGASFSSESFSVSVDAEAPVLELSNPTYGQHRTSTGAFTVNGTVTDSASAITEVVIDGQALSFTPSQSVNVSTSFSPRWGANVVSGYAVDACGNKGYLALPFVASDEYGPAVTSAQESATIRQAATLQLSQNFVDDGDRGDADDLATIAENALQEVDFDEILPPGAVLVSEPTRSDCNGFPGPTFASVGVIAWRHPTPSRKVNVEGPWLDQFAFKNGALGFGVEVRDFDFPLRTKVTILQCTLGDPQIDIITVDAWVGLDKLDVDGLLGLNVADTVATGSIEDINFDVDEAYLHIDCGSFDWACDSVSDLIMGAAEGLIEDMVEEQVAELVPPMVSESLTGFEIDTVIPLPEPINLALGVKGALDTVRLCGPNVGLPQPVGCGSHNTNPGSLGAALDMQVFPLSRGSSIPLGSKGPVMLNHSIAPKFNDSVSSVGAGVRLDLVNQALWALWYGGALSLPSLRDAFGDELPEGIDGSISVGIAPMLMPGEGDNLLDLGLADLQIDVSADMSKLLGEPEAPPLYVNASFTITVIVGAALDVDGDRNQVTVSVADTPQIHLQVNSINDLLYTEALGGMLGDIMTEQLPAMLSSATQVIELPTVDLSELPGTPSKSVWGVTNPQISVDDGYLAVSGLLGPVQ